MNTAFESLTGRSLEWMGIHHSARGDFTDLACHVVSFVSDDECRVTVDGNLVAEGPYTYTRMNARIAVLIYRPNVYQGRSGVVLYATLDFEELTDRAVILADGKPLAVAQGSFREVANPAQPATGWK